MLSGWWDDVGVVRRGDFPLVVPSLDDERQDRMSYMAGCAFIASHLAARMGHNHVGRWRTSVLHPHRQGGVPEEASMDRLVEQLDLVAAMCVHAIDIYERRIIVKEIAERLPIVRIPRRCPFGSEVTDDPAVDLPVTQRSPSRPRTNDAGRASDCVPASRRQLASGRPPLSDRTEALNAAARAPTAMPRSVIP